MKKLRKKSSKKGNKKRFIIIALILLIILTISIILYSQTNKKGYEFYDINNNFGTSSKCEIKNETLICNVNGYDVPVKQFSKIE